MAAGPYIVLHSEASRGWGGQEIRIFEEMKIMRERHHRVLLVTVPDSDIRRKAEEAGFETILFSDKKSRYPLTILELARTLARLRPHVVNTHSSRDGWICGIASRLAGIPALIRSRHIEVDYQNLLTSRIGFAYLPHHVITTSDRISTRLCRELSLPPEAVQCIPTGIHLGRFKPEGPARLHTELGLKPETILVGMVSVLRSWKGHEYFLQALQHLVRAHEFDIRGIIAGEGPMRSRIEEKIEKLKLKDHVTLLGHRSDVPEILRSLRVIVLPSTAHEGIPQIILQAKATQTPIVASTAGGIPEVIRHEVSGLLVPPKDAFHLAEAIARMLRTPSLAAKLSEQALSEARERHSLNHMADELEALYASLLKDLQSS